MKTSKSLENGDTEAYWAGIDQGRLLLQKCLSCGHVQFPPRFQCADCWDDRLDWVESSCLATVESYTIVRRAPLSDFRDQVPYAIASVLLAEGPRLIANVVGEGALDVAIGDSVVVEIDTHEERPLPRLRLDAMSAKARCGGDNGDARQRSA